MAELDGERTARRPRFRAIWLAPVLILISFGAWVFASPAGSSPDDDYHLVSIWCAAGDRTSLCEDGSDATNRMVSEKLVQIACFARDSTESAACQSPILESDRLVETARGNFAGEYPPLYYGFMSLFASDDVLSSVVIMRFVNVLIFAGIATAMYLLLPRGRRRTLVWGWAATVVPLGLFLIASNNPSSWAVIGVGSLPLALLGYFEAEARRRLALGAVAALSVVLAAGARADGALYSILVIGGVVVLTAVRSRRYLRDLIFPGVLAVAAALLLLSSSQILAGLFGFGGSAFAAAPTGGHGFALTADTPVDFFGLLLSNILNTPSLWAGVFGYWALGWFDTPLPQVVAFGGVAVFVAACFTGLRELNLRKGIVVAATAIGLWVIPVFTLTRGGDPVGVEVQPRYLLPLIVVLAMFALLSAHDRRFFTRAQAILMAVTLMGTYAVALYYNIRRYATGTDGGGLDLGAGAEWWWSGLPNPSLIAIIGCLSWIALLAIVLRELGRPAPATSIPSAS